MAKLVWVLCIILQYEQALVNINKAIHTELTLAILRAVELVNKLRQTGRLAP